MIPAIPGFAGDIQGSSGTLAILGAQYQSISRGGKSICELIEKAGFNPHDYVEFYNLRSYDRLNNDPARLRRMQENSGISFEQAQAALARYVAANVTSAPMLTTALTRQRVSGTRPRSSRAREEQGH